MSAKQSQTDRVVAVNPRRDPSLVISVQQLLSVEPFFVADLRARWLGRFGTWQKEIGDPVKQGELLVDIKVPDLEEQLLEKEVPWSRARNRISWLPRRPAENARALVAVFTARPSSSVAPNKDKRWPMRSSIQVQVPSATQLLRKVDDVRRVACRRRGRLRDYAATLAGRGRQAAVSRAEADVHEKESALTDRGSRYRAKERPNRGGPQVP